MRIIYYLCLHLFGILYVEELL